MAGRAPAGLDWTGWLGGGVDGWLIRPERAKNDDGWESTLGELVRWSNCFYRWDIIGISLELSLDPYGR
jgi:hypothetical protein